MIVLALSFAISACGKKAPLRAPDDPKDQSLIG
jgi:predicted small lipoprotein YifL